MRQIEIEENVPHNKVHVQRRQVDASEQAEHVNRYEAGGVRVQAVVKQFAERSAGARSACLLPIDAICVLINSVNLHTTRVLGGPHIRKPYNTLTQRIRQEYINSSDEPNDAGHGICGLIGRLKSIVIIADEQKIDYGQQETGERYQVGCHPSGEILHAMVPERVHNIDAEYAGIDAVVLMIRRKRRNKSVDHFVKLYYLVYHIH